MQDKWYKSLVLLILAAFLLVPFPASTSNAALDVVYALILVTITPFAVHLLITVLNSDAKPLTRNDALRVAASVGLTLVLAFLVGLFQSTFYTCWDFRVAGWQAPEGCREK